MADVLLSIYGGVCGIPLVVMILGVGVWLACKAGFPQVRLFPAAVKAFAAALRNPENGQGTSSYRAFCTALGATVGTGNIVGVAGAICLGGPGAVFWMWVCGFFAMGTKYAEAALAVRYRKTEGAETVGGPMYMITEGLGNRWRYLAAAYSVFGLIASLGVGNAAQVNAMLSGINHAMRSFGKITSVRTDLGIGLILTVLTGGILLGGARRIGAAAEVLVPVASCFYLVISMAVLAVRYERIVPAFAAILSGAFSPAAVTGGVLGSVHQALRVGCSRGVFTNEAGMGTAAMAHGSARVQHPAEQGLMGILEVFLDTIVICTVTALVILVSGISVPYGQDAGGTLTASAFALVLGNWTGVALAAAICCFAFTAILGWGLYGRCCACFLFGSRGAQLFALLQTAAVMLGIILNTETVWLLSELFNGLMAIPNLIVLSVLAPELGRLTNEYIKKEGGIAAEGGNHADFHQCQPLRALSHEKVPSLRGGGGSAGKEDLSSEYRSA